MNRRLIVTLIGLFALAAGGYGVWIAWDTGLVGGSARAPVASAMEASVRRQAVVNALMIDRDDPCATVELGLPPPDVAGFAGITPNAAPGQYAITLLLETEPRYQPSREVQIAQLDYLAAHGLLKRSDVEVETGSGPRPARNYALTWEGYESTQHAMPQSMCIDYGRREFAGIKQIEKSPEKVMDLEVYDVAYRTRVRVVPTWATTPEAARAFPKLPELIAERISHAKLIRTRQGWRASYEMDFDTAAAANGPKAADAARLMAKALFAEPPTHDQVTAMVKEKLSDPNWVAQSGVACLPLRLQRGGDDQVARRDTGSSFTVTYYDRPDRNQYEYAPMATALQVLSALESAGLATMDYVDSVASGPVPHPSGVRFRITDEALAALGLPGGGGCVPAGRITVDTIKIHSAPGETWVMARATVTETPAWVLKLAARLPALQALITTGMPMTGMIRFAPEEGGAGHWIGNGLEPMYPTVSYATLPAHLTPVMPKTSAAFPSPSIKAPAFSAPGAAPVSNRLSEAAALPAPEPVQSASAASTPYPANNSHVHVVSINDAPLPGGGHSGFGRHPDGMVSVVVSDPDASLLLLSYEPIEWRITAANGVRLRRIVAIGFYDQRVKLNGGGTPEVTTGKPGVVLKDTGIDLNNGFPTQSDANSLVTIAKITRVLTGTTPQTFQGRATAPTEGFVVGPTTPRFVMPERRGPGQVGGSVTLKGESVRGELALRGMSGAYTEAYADRSYSAGKAYFEGTMRVTGSLAGHGAANIGVCLARFGGIDTPGHETMAIAEGEQRLHADGEVFGIAADFDQHRLYRRVNGVWIGGAPGGSGGLPLENNKEYRACFFASGTTTGEVASGQPRSDTTWQVNFGARPFAQPIPPGFVPYQ
ncbi:MAG: hypothetical protein WCD08_05820 [Steroidobacteraceae bacterium]